MTLAQFCRFAWYMYLRRYALEDAKVVRWNLKHPYLSQPLGFVYYQTQLAVARWKRLRAAWLFFWWGRVPISTGLGVFEK